MPKARAIPLIADKAEMYRHSERVRLLRQLIQYGRWSLEETLRAFSQIVFYSGRPRRARVLAWLEELLFDLKATKNRVNSADDGDALWKDAD